MSDEFDVIARLHALADQPLDEAVAARHADLLEAEPAWSRRSRWRTVVAGGTIAAAVFGGTGIAAAAGNLPTGAQNAAHTVLAKVGVDVPRGTPRSTEGCDGKTYANHGQFVRSQPKGAARDAAAQSNCGKPLVSTQGGAKDDGSTTSTTEDHAGNKANPDKGKSGEDHGKPATTPGGSSTPGKSTAPGQVKKSGK